LFPERIRLIDLFLNQWDTLSLGLLRILARDFIGVQGLIRTNAIFFGEYLTLVLTYLCFFDTLLL
jgi:hypothetical protein